MPLPAPARPARARRPLLLVLGVIFILLQAAAPAQAQTPSQPGTTVAPKPYVSTPLFSARRLPGLMRSNIADQKLAESLKGILVKAPATSCVTISVRGRQVLRHNGEVALEPASLTKLVTAAGVLQHFKPEDKLATVAAAAAPADRGVITGNLWIIGGGDALITTPGYKQSFRYPEQTVSDLASLADRIKAAGITEIRGDIIGDDTRYDAQRYIPSWPQSYKREDTVGPLSALMVNDGVTGYSKTPDKVSSVRQAGDPPVLAAETLRTYLADRGVKVSGKAASGKAPAPATEVARIETTIGDSVNEMLLWSDNTTAELLGKELGLKAKGAGTTANGTTTIVAALDQIGVPTQGILLNDASGLDPGNRISCDTLSRLLDKVGFESPIGKGLPTAGKTGSLRPRMRGAPLEGNVMGKTGTLTTPPVLSLAGFEKTRSGELATFAFIQNGIGADQGLQDAMAVALYEYPQAPDLTPLLPQAPKLG